MNRTRPPEREDSRRIFPSLSTHRRQLLDHLAQGGALAAHQMDVAENAGFHDRLAFLGISLLALAGVLVGLAAVLRQSRAGWFSLGTAGAIVAVSAILAVLAML